MFRAGRGAGWLPVPRNLSNELCIPLFLQYGTLSEVDLLHAPIRSVVVRSDRDA